MYELKINKIAEFSFDEPFSKEQKPYKESLLTFCNLIVKLALEKNEFYQIGKLPKFFLRSEMQEIRS